MLGSRKGLRDINKGINDMRSGARQIKLAGSPPEKQIPLLIEERDARLKESEGARSKAYGFGAKRFVEQAERAEHEAAKAQKQIDKLVAENPHVQPVRKRTFMEYTEALNKADAESKRRHKEGVISRDQMRQEMKDNKEREKTEPVDIDPVVPVGQSVPERLESLRTLLDQGVVSEAEYAAQRARIIGDM